MNNLLIVEDERMIRHGLRYTIDWMALDITVVGEAANGQEGYEKILELKPDIVLTDIKMPKMSGMDMLEAASKKHTFHTLILTSYSEFSYAQKGIQLGVFDYILKPVDERQLQQTVKKLTEKITIQRELESRTVKMAFYEELLDGTRFRQGSMNDYVKQCLSYIQNHYTKKISLEEMAAYLSVSSSYLSRTFKKETSYTFSDFLNRYRIMKAISLLQTQEYRVYEIADQVGFSDYKHFCAVFKKYISCSPTEFLHHEVGY